jgi:RHS repeat-associated protein
VHYLYDDWSQLIESFSDDTGTVRTEFDARGLELKRREANATVTAWEYDRAGRVTRIDYDSLTPANNGGDRRFWYDALPSGVSCPSGACTNLLGRLAYVENDATLPNMYKTMYGYTSAGLIRLESNSVGTYTMNTEYQYDSFGRRTRLVFPFGTGDSVRYAYNSAAVSHDAEQPSALNWDFNNNPYGDAIERIDRMPHGPISRLWYYQRTSGALPGTASVERQYRRDGALQSAQWASGNNGSSNVASWALSYANDGHLTGIQNYTNPSESINYRYDSLGHLDCATEGPVSSTCVSGHSQAVATYGTNTSGNRVSSWDRFSTQDRSWLGLGAGWVTNRSYGWTRPSWGSSDGVWYYWGPGWGGSGPGQRIFDYRQGYERTYSYWPNGEPAAVGVYDSRGSSSVAMANDHRGRRLFTRSIAPGGYTVERWFVYDDSDRLIGVHHTDGTTTRDEMFFHADNEAVFRIVIDNGAAEVERTYLYNDHLATPRIGVSIASTGALQGVTYRAPREPYMASVPVLQNPVPMQLRFPGQWRDELTELLGPGAEDWGSALLGNHARVMDPTAGAYAGMEPMWQTGGRHVMAAFTTYANGNPIQYVDPDGRAAQLILAWFASPPGQAATYAAATTLARILGGLFLASVALESDRAEPATNTCTNTMSVEADLDDDDDCGGAERAAAVIAGSICGNSNLRPNAGPRFQNCWSCCGWQMNTVGGPGASRNSSCKEACLSACLSALPVRPPADPNEIPDYY